MPTVLASQSVKLAVRLTRGWVSSSIVPTAKMTKKRSEAESRRGEVLSERMKRKVIAPYANACTSLSRPPTCNRNDIASWGRWLRKTTVVVKMTAIISHLISK